MTSRELVYKTLEFKNENGRMPRQLWHLPCAELAYPGAIDEILTRFPTDIVGAPRNLEVPLICKGDKFAIGEYIDEWGCMFTNIHPGIIGEVKKPLVKGDEWEDIDNIHIPEELLTFSIDDVNEFCRTTDKFVQNTGGVDLFERLQHIRGSENLYCDLIICPEGVKKALDRIHDFNCRLFERWGQTEIDAFYMKDDWGSNNALLISPDMWRETFKPLYKDYCDIAKKYGKKVFMHSDGNILEIIPDLIEIGVDALNSQVFLMGLENVEKYKGKITFWGEIDRQHILVNCTPQETKEAARKVKNTLWDNGGFIAELEFGPGAKAENVIAAYEAWYE